MTYREISERAGRIRVKPNTDKQHANYASLKAGQHILANPLAKTAPRWLPDLASQPDSHITSVL